MEQLTIDWYLKQKPSHDGKTFERELDLSRLNDQTRRVYDAMASGRWRTLAEIAELTGDPEASVSARLRDLRKVRFGSHTVERRRFVVYAISGLWQYRLVLEPRP